MHQSRRCRQYLTDIDFEDGTGYSFGYTSDGLMTSMTNPRGLISTHSFDDTGRVIGTEDPEHGAWTLDRVNYSDGAVQSSITSSENNTTSHLDTIEPGNVIRSVTTSPGGDTSTFVRKNQNLRSIWGRIFILHIITTISCFLFNFAKRQAKGRRPRHRPSPPVARCQCRIRPPYVAMARQCSTEPETTTAYRSTQIISPPAEKAAKPPATAIPQPANCNG